MLSTRVKNNWTLIVQIRFGGCMAPSGWNLFVMICHDLFPGFVTSACVLHRENIYRYVLWPSPFKTHFEQQFINTLELIYYRIVGPEKKLLQSIGLFFGSARFLCWMPLFVFIGLPIVSCSMMNSLILGCLWPLVFVLNNTLTLGIWRSAISHLPGCFATAPSFRILVPSDPFMSHLATHLGYSEGEFQALQLIVYVLIEERSI